MNFRGVTGCVRVDFGGFGGSQKRYRGSEWALMKFRIPSRKIGMVFSELQRHYSELQGHFWIFRWVSGALQGVSIWAWGF